MDLFKRIQNLSDLYDNDGPSSTVPESRPMFDKGGMAKLVSYVEGLPKESTVTLQMVQDYVKKNNLNVNIKNFFDRNAKTIKDKTFISDTRSKDLKLTSEEKANIEKYGQEKYDKLKNKYSKLRVRQGQDVGSLAPEKQQKVKFKKEYDKAIKYYKSRGIEEPNMDSIRKNIARNDGKFNATGSKLQSEPGLTGLFKNYEKADLIADLKKGKNLSEISIEYLDKNEKQVLKMLEGKRDYTKPLGRLSTDLSNIISGDEEATKLYDKIKKTNSFNKLKNKSTYKKAVETLIPFAQEQGLIPNVNLKGKKINTASDYFNYAYKVKRDPVAKLFGFYERVGIEHPGGVARALIFDDPATLNEIVATMPDTNFAAGSTYDTYATGQARFFEKTKDPKYIKKINQIILNKQKEYGKPRTILDVDGDNVTRRATKFSLTNPNLIEDSKSFINEYVAAGGSQRKNFNKLDPSLQQSILAFEEGNKIKGNKFLKTALKDTGAEAEFKNTLQKLGEKNLNAKNQQLIKDQFCTNRKGGQPGSCSIGEAMDNMIKQTNAVKQGAIKGTEATRIANKASKVARFGTGKGLGAVLGPIGLAGEAVFEVAMAVPGYGKGESGKRLLGDSILGLIPGVGQSAEEEFDEYATKDGMSQLEQQKIKDANRFLELNDALSTASNVGILEGRGAGRGGQNQALKLFEKQYQEYEPLYNQFVGGPPSESASTALAEQQRINDLINADKAIRAEQRDIAMDEDFMAAGGGIAKEAGDRSGAMTRSMNPDSQGLSYLFNRVKKV